jgi:hypothetical protein
VTERPGARALPAWQLEGFAIDAVTHTAERLALDSPRWRRMEREAVAAASRIRAQVREARCRCDYPLAQLVDPRCARCWGRRA